MEVEFLTDAQAAGIMRAQIQRLETELHNLQMQNKNLVKTMVALCVVNGPLELPADLPPNFARQWEVKKKRVRNKLVLSAVMTHAKAVA